MADRSKYRSHKLGLPPGTLVLPPGKKSENTKISLIHWNAESIERQEGVAPLQISPFLEKEGTTWVMVEGIRDLKALEELGRVFDLHPLMLEDICNPIQRPKLDDYQDKIFIVIELLHYINKQMKIEDEQVSIVLGKNYVITFLQSKNALLEPIVKRLNNENSRVRHGGSDYITYALVDLIIDYSFATIEVINTVLNKIEEQMLIKPPEDAPSLIQKSKKLVWDLRTSLFPMREVISQFQRLETPWINKATKFYMHDVSDHIYQGLDLIESSRDTTLSLLDIHHSYQNQKLNDVMKTLTVVATIFVPLTFISSLYGMNFKHMPELNWAWGYPLTIGVMVLVAAGMLCYFRKNEWI